MQMSQDVSLPGVFKAQKTLVPDLSLQAARE